MKAQLDRDCWVAVLAAATHRLGVWDLRELCRLSCVSRDWHAASREILGTRVLALTPASFGLRASLARCRLDASGVLQHCAALERLSLAGLHRMASDELLQVAAASCPHLQEVCLDYCSGVTTAGLEALARDVPGLRCLSLRRCEGVKTVGGLRHLSRLEDLDLSYHEQVDVAALASSCGTMRRLCLHGCESVRDDICGLLPLAEDVVLAFTSVTDAGLAALAANSPRLRTLCLAKQNFNLWQQTGLWTNSGLQAFKDAAPQAKVVLISC